jgi:protein-tyrosine phosphatase
MFNSINQIVPHLYISNWETSNNPTELRNNNIKAVLTIETERKPKDILNFYKNNEIDFMFLYCFDYHNQDIERYFDISFNFIDKHIKKGENVLVHCRAGISRSATLILHYMIRKYYENDGFDCPNCVVQKMLSHAQHQRQIINPNIGFKHQLFSRANKYYTYLF